MKNSLLLLLLFILCSCQKDTSAAIEYNTMIIQPQLAIVEKMNEIDKAKSEEEIKSFRTVLLKYCDAAILDVQSLYALKGGEGFKNAALEYYKSVKSFYTMENIDYLLDIAQNGNIKIMKDEDILSLNDGYTRMKQLEDILIDEQTKFSEQFSISFK